MRSWAAAWPSLRRSEVNVSSSETSAACARASSAASTSDSGVGRGSSKVETKSSRWAVHRLEPDERRAEVLLHLRGEHAAVAGRGERPAERVSRGPGERLERGCGRVDGASSEVVTGGTVEPGLTGQFSTPCARPSCDLDSRTPACPTPRAARSAARRPCRGGALRLAVRGPNARGASGCRQRLRRERCSRELGSRERDRRSGGAGAGPARADSMHWLPGRPVVGQRHPCSRARGRGRRPDARAEAAFPGEGVEGSGPAGVSFAGAGVEGSGVGPVCPFGAGAGRAAPRVRGAPSSSRTPSLRRRHRGGRRARRERWHPPAGSRDETAVEPHLGVLEADVDGGSAGQPIDLDQELEVPAPAGGQ